MAVAKAVGYMGAGTVEFLFHDGEFWFLEMNTRLQVEHPVTEMITGLDLVRLQIEIAERRAGCKRRLLHPTIEGHAIEARLYAEDPAHDYLPVTGTVHRFSFPEQPGLRVDSGVEDGSEISIHYDPMLAKVIAHAPTRDEAAAGLADALRHARIHGPTTNRELLVRILENEDFIAGRPTPTSSRLTTGGSDRPAGRRDRSRSRRDRRRGRRPAVSEARGLVLASIPAGWRNSPTSPRERLPMVGQLTIESGTTSTRTALVDQIPVGVTFDVDGETGAFAVDRAGSMRYVDGPSRTGDPRGVPRFAVTEIDEAPGSLHAPMPGRVSGSR